jgi:hypothetical protein
MKPLLRAVPVFVLLVLAWKIVTVHAQSGIRPVLVSYMNQIGFRRFTAVRSDGAWVSGQYLLRTDGKEYLIRGVTFPAEGRIVSVLSDIGALRTSYSKNPRGPSLDDPASSCVVPVRGAYAVKRKIMGMESILGQSTIHLREESGDDIHEAWEAPALGCISLKDVLTDKTTGALIVDDEATAVVLAEPNASLFTVPNGYTEMSPSQSNTAFGNKFSNGQVPASIRRKEPRMNAIYQAQHAPK